MKSYFSTSWKSSIQNRKQRKYRHNAPIHIKKKFLSANMSKPLRKKYGFRNITLRKGDKVKIMRGKFRKHVGDIIKVDIKRTRIFVDGAQNSKKEGAKFFQPIDPSNLQIIEMNLDDKYRNKILNRKSKNVEKTSEKTKRA